MFIKSHLLPARSPGAAAKTRAASRSASVTRHSPLAAASRTRASWAVSASAANARCNVLGNRMSLSSTRSTFNQQFIIIINCPLFCFYSLLYPTPLPTASTSSAARQRFVGDLWELRSNDDWRVRCVELLVRAVELMHPHSPHSSQQALHQIFDSAWPHPHQLPLALWRAP